MTGPVMTVHEHEDVYDAAAKMAAARTFGACRSSILRASSSVSSKSTTWSARSHTGRRRVQSPAPPTETRMGLRMLRGHFLLTIASHVEAAE